MERVTKFLDLVHLPDGYKAPQLRDALIAQTQLIPETWRKTLTWDQGREMSMHEPTAAATGFGIYFCDPHSPWQRGLNENTYWGGWGARGFFDGRGSALDGRVTQKNVPEGLVTSTGVV